MHAPDRSIFASRLSSPFAVFNNLPLTYFASDISYFVADSPNIDLCTFALMSFTFWWHSVGKLARGGHGGGRWWR